MKKFTRLTKQEVSNSVAKRWEAIYKNWTYDSRKMSILKQLQALPPNPSAQSIKEIIGNSSWTRLECDLCKQEVDAITAVGFPAFWKSDHFNLCDLCIINLHQSISTTN